MPVSLTRVASHGEGIAEVLVTQGEVVTFHGDAVPLNHQLVLPLEAPDGELARCSQIPLLLRRPFLLHQARPPLTRLHDLGNSVYDWGWG